jgi:hypothetical protein
MTIQTHSFTVKLTMRAGTMQLKKQEVILEALRAYTQGTKQTNNDKKNQIAFINMEMCHSIAAHKHTLQDIKQLVEDFSTFFNEDKRVSRSLFLMHGEIACDCLWQWLLCNCCTKCFEVFDLIINLVVSCLHWMCGIRHVIVVGKHVDGDVLRKNTESLAGKCETREARLSKQSALLQAGHYLIQTLVVVTAVQRHIISRDYEKVMTPKPLRGNSRRGFFQYVWFLQ